MTTLTNLYSIVFSPLVGEDEGEYMCSATVEPKGAHIIGTTVEGLYSLIPLGEFYHVSLAMRNIPEAVLIMWYGTAYTGTVCVES